MGDELKGEEGEGKEVGWEGRGLSSRTEVEGKAWIVGISLERRSKERSKSSRGEESKSGFERVAEVGKKQRSGRQQAEKCRDDVRV